MQRGRSMCCSCGSPLAVLVPCLITCEMSTASSRTPDDRLTAEQSRCHAAVRGRNAPGFRDFLTFTNRRYATRAAPPFSTVINCEHPMSALTIRTLPRNLRRPILITAFSGWNDAAESATTAAKYLATTYQAEKFAEIDPEEFYHFGLTRPMVRFKADGSGEREIVWPVTEFSVVRSGDLPRDLVIGVASEPHLKWRTYCATILELARQCEITLVLSLGALLAEVPHTRPVRIAGGASDPELAAQLGVRPSKYEGPTGIVGVLGTACREAGMTHGSLWANVPHYISGIENPKATRALVQRVLTLMNVPAELTDLDEAAKQFDQNLAEIVSQNAKIKSYVTKLESKASEEDEPVTPGTSDLPPASQLVDEIEQFMRQQRPE